MEKQRFLQLKISILTGDFREVVSCLDRSPSFLYFLDDERRNVFHYVCLSRSILDVDKKLILEKLQYLGFSYLLRFRDCFGRVPIEYLYRDGSFDLAEYLEGMMSDSF